LAKKCVLNALDWEGSKPNSLHINGPHTIDIDGRMEVWLSLKLNHL